MRKAHYRVVLDVTEFGKAVKKYVKRKSEVQEVLKRVLDDHLKNYLRLYRLRGRIVESEMEME